MPTILATANEIFCEVYENLSLAVNVSLADSFFIGNCFIDEKYELIGLRAVWLKSDSSPSKQLFKHII